MRATTALVFVCCTFALRVGLAEEVLPRKAHVGNKTAVVHSGPGAQHYATDELQPGEEVEVWRRRADGWLAIRPPKSSFSLIEGRGLRRLPGTDLAEVIGENIVSWVGSTTSDGGRCGWQIRLHAGEKVVVLGEERRSLHNGSPPKPVYRIAPPAGEFRWIHERDLRGVSSLSPERADGAVRLADYQIVVPAEDKRSTPESPRRDGFVARKNRTTRDANPSSGAQGDSRVRAKEVASRSTRADADGTLEDLEVRAVDHGLQTGRYVGRQEPAR